jgi:hypothetical protein
MRSFLIAFSALTLLASSAAQAKVAISIDKDSQQMTVAVDGVERYHWPVSSGIPSRETPNGSFRTFRMEEDHFSKEFDDARCGGPGDPAGPPVQRADVQAGVWQPPALAGSPGHFDPAGLVPALAHGL